MKLAWGKKVSKLFCERVVWIGKDLEFDPGFLMGCMAFETGRTFRADIKNAGGSGATGLIQFMPQTAGGLGTSTQALAAMLPENQLNYVWKYFEKWRGRLHNLGDIYMAILWPAAVGKPENYALFDRDGPKPVQYMQNKGLDLDMNGLITRKEAAAKVQAHYDEGLSASLAREM